MTLGDEARQQLRALLDEHGSAAGVLRDALKRGEVEGDLYWRSESGCGCVLGTIAAAEGAPNPSTAGLTLSDELRFLAVENWALDISPGDTPDEDAEPYTGPYRAAMLVQWIDEWEAERVAT